MTPEKIAEEFQLSGHQLKSYIFRITSSIEDTEDIMQDVVIKATSKRASFREKAP
ncbi:MAG: hypothetical protein IPK25_10415 [Saprospiraceae bacterium]|nr:hypothetical protein [Saprospiraceae bacterium]